MRIIELIGALDDGGAETLVVNYADLLGKLGHEVEILTVYNRIETANSRRVKKLGLQAKSLFPSFDFVYRCLKRVTKSRFVSMLLWKEIELFRPDVIHVHLSWLHIVSPLRKRIKDIKLFYTCHNLPSLFFEGKRINEYVAAKKLLCENNLQFIALHKEMEIDLNNRFNIQSRIINNGIVFSNYRDIVVDIYKKKRSLEVPSDSFLIGNIGRFSEEKNHVFLLNVFAQLLEYNSKAHLLLLGWGELEKEIREQISSLYLDNKVTILSHRTDVPEILKCLDAFVLPSKFEGLSVALVEAQVAGVRCIISDNVSEESVLSDKVSILSLKESKEKWAKTILYSKGNVDRWGDIEQFDMNKEIIKLEKLYKGEEAT